MVKNAWLIVLLCFSWVPIGIFFLFRWRPSWSIAERASEKASRKWATNCIFISITLPVSRIVEAFFQTDRPKFRSFSVKKKLNCYIQGTLVSRNSRSKTSSLFISCSSTIFTEKSADDADSFVAASSKPLEFWTPFGKFRIFLG